MTASGQLAGDPDDQLENALLNLAINARDAMLPDGGELRIRTGHVRLTEADLAGWAGARSGEYVRISVIDTGTGMSPDVLEHAFEPFFTTKPDGHGTGLGLSQVFGFISQSNGVVRIETRLGFGTAVHLDTTHPTGCARHHGRGGELRQWDSNGAAHGRDNLAGRGRG